MSCRTTVAPVPKDLFVWIAGSGWAAHANPSPSLPTKTSKAWISHSVDKRVAASDLAGEAAVAVLLIPPLPRKAALSQGSAR
eukprot:573237-Alexandrium_andersonii.AAC.1